MNMAQSAFHANHCKCVSIWRNDDGKSFTVAFCHDSPAVGVRHATFDRQRDAIAWAHKHLPGVPVWIEKREFYQLLHGTRESTS